jgi:glycosyltransferase involved in cell wall biosynthesis
MLDSLLIQECDGSFDYEFIVVDNNSKDNTKEILESYIPKFNGKLKYLLESKQGKSFALNLALKEAKGEIVIFTDDDVIVDKSWLNNYFLTFKQNNCDAACGRILPLFNGFTPDWVKKNFDLLMNGPGPLLIYDYGIGTYKYDSNKMMTFFGGNMAFKKELFNSCGYFRTDLGPGSGTSGEGEEIEFLRRVERISDNLYYCGNALVWHKVDNKRTSLRYLAKWWITSGKEAVATECNNNLDTVTFCFGFPRYLIREIMEDSISLIFVIFSMRKILKKWRKIFKNIGKIIGYRRVHK